MSLSQVNQGCLSEELDLQDQLADHVDAQFGQHFLQPKDVIVLRMFFQCFTEDFRLFDNTGHKSGKVRC